MPRLEEKMKRASERAAEQLPEEALEIMQGHTEQLQREGLAEEAVGRAAGLPSSVCRPPPEERSLSESCGSGVPSS